MKTTNMEPIENIENKEIKQVKKKKKTIKKKLEKETSEKKKRKTKKRPIFFLLENDILTRMSSPSSHHLEGIADKEEKEEKKEKGEKKTRKRRLKTPVELIIMENPNSNPGKRYNEDFIELMDKLSNIMSKKGELFRARAYQKAQESIITYPTDIFTVDQLKDLPGIGSIILEKLNEYIKTGTLKILEREKDNPLYFLSDIYGVGPKKAQELINLGITTLDQLKEKQNEVLNETQRTGLKYYDDILKRIPRSEIQEYEKVFTKAFDEVIKNDPTDSHLEIVGSYRRGAANSGDIDVIITSKTSDVYKQFIDFLVKEKVIVEILSRGASKCLVITKLPGYDTARRVDFLYTNLNEYPFAVLYFTGSKFFNTVMRHHALKKGYTFNEHGMYELENKKKGAPVSHIFTNEKSIFDFLGLEYKAPVERIDGRAIKAIMNENVDENVAATVNKVVVKKNKTVKKKLGKEPENKHQESNEQLQAFKKIGITFLDQLNEKQLSELILYANKMYYEKTPLLSDNEYDIVKEYTQNKYPENQVILEVGAPVERNKVKLPYEMASMDKIKPDTNALEVWQKKFTGPYVLSCKLDGVSALYSTEGAVEKLYTRGNGKIGQDISHLIPYLKLPKNADITVRGELLILKDDFEKYLKEKFANPRNLVSGLVNQKQVDENIKYVHFVAYEVIHPELKPVEQMDFLETLDIERVMYEVRESLTNEMLSELLVKWRKDYKFEIDGVIVADDKIYPRKSGNPDHAFAFKMVLSDQIAEAKVVDVIWTPSKDGYLKPRVRIEPIHLGGVTIEYATGFNGAFIEQNKIGIGALIEIIRSGDVIPYIKGVTVPAEEGKMPNVPYQWNDTHIDVLLEDLNDPTVKEKNITGFFKGLRVDGLSSGNVHRIMVAGFDSIPKIIAMNESDFLKVDGFKQKLAHKIYEGIKDKVKNATLVQLMAHSNLLGRGISEKKIEIIVKELPDILSSLDTKEVKIQKLTKVKGMAKKTAESFVNKIDSFVSFLQEIGQADKMAVVLQPILVIDHPLNNKNIVLTGLRDKTILELIKGVGANVSSNVSKNTFLVIARNKEEDTGKAEEARKLDIPIVTVEEFMETYFPK